MKLSDFGYDLPAARIATAPARPRDSAKLLHVQADALADYTVQDLPGLLRAGDRLVVNDTRVIPAQLSAMRGSARIGITLDKPNEDGDWRVLLRNAKRVRAGDVLAIDEAFSATVMAVQEGGTAMLRFNVSDEAFLAALERTGALALPPYIARPEGITAQDKADYQTMFAAHDGAVAAPTAGLHFTPELLAALDARGVEITRVTLHVGAGTFLPVRVEDVTTHKMHAERGYVSAEAAAQINETKDRGGRIIPVGTTALRLIESAANDDGVVRDFAGDTDIFIYPGYQFKVANLLFTNFHLPHSTLLMLVSAFAGMVRIQSAYAHAIANEYRFYSYGDACLLERA
ncbi:MAG: tRNA preQ1(34) S-adenosylmethionine ribosyltransferase-isomerase QueA [Acidocella sp. 20-57-95]|nr:MAG: tRNA preQ1(34) S-adenosylmethionine ribosyltransferase-isomerase QueA [Acidocella sp. 20-57-95]OYV62730.1 MAG: tRNA preQ1(34) S-adenosylmethionine ribosyltransferase-isomerase QueA [Acidocella sp. 21-58-7]HQT65395.1 tRNA preQ1(34) S-adenosylmethionine ribosyltransferase-isomerase QueA [Acidocella sp.]HQU03282.1 tRNA preQ1(34) S-adenosylmethionine ribosyltransferase-isomerase QueA [Acidocella sp.]